MISSPSLLLALRFVGGSLFVGLGLYVVVGAAIFRHYYVQRRSEAQKWKCQPDRFPTPRMQQADLRLGLFNLSVGSALSGLLAYYAATGGRTGLYFTVGERGLGFTLLSTVCYFLATDLLLYAAHRIYHRPRLFRLIHRVHHRNTTPTPFTAYSMHPIEFLTYEAVALLPLFFFPVYAGAAIATLLYSNITAMLQHSGVRMSSLLPWQPVTLFHDDHHKFFHVNYGQNLALWDRVFGTLRRHDRRYGAEIFGGRGAPRGSVTSAAEFVDYRGGIRVDSRAITPDELTP